VLLDQGAITQEELDRKLGLEEKVHETFKPGDRVYVRHENYATRWRKPHLRTPGYIFTKSGVIERVCGDFSNPETCAFRIDKTPCPLYRVRFFQKDIWEDYPGSANDTIDIEITHYWLTREDQSIKPDNSKKDVISTPHSHSHKDEHGHEHEHQHDEHGHGHEHPHPHDERLKSEQKAIDQEGEESPFQYLAKKLIELILEKNILTPQEITQRIELLDRLETEPVGQTIVAHAWTDPNFKKVLLHNPAEAGDLIGVKIPPILIAVENTEEIHNVVVCTLCSCYPRQVLGRPPDWYKSRAYRSRTVYEPRKVLTEFGTVIPDHVTIRVHDSTADMRYLVIPKRPEGTEGFSLEQLMKLITRDSMIGVTQALSPAH